MIEAVLLGTGAGKADPARFSPSNVVWVDGDPVVVDVGNGSLLRMRSAGIYPGEVRTVFLTHLHFDHYSDYPYLVIEPLIGEAAFSRGQLTVYGPPGTERLVRHFERTYDVEYDAYASLAGYEQARELSRANVIEFWDGWTLDLGSMRVIARQVDHGVVAIPSFGFRFEDESGKSLVFSGDTVPCAGIVELATGADVLVHESTLPPDEVELRKARGFAWRIHSTPTDAGLVARQAGVKRLVLNHFAAWNSFEPGRPAYDWAAIAPPAVAEEFAGEVVVGEDLMRIDV
jgi:ribonuclease Z